MKGELVKEQQRSAGLERARAAFLAAWREKRLRSGAARVIQRHFRARRMRQLLSRTRLNAKVLCCPSRMWAQRDGLLHQCLNSTMADDMLSHFCACMQMHQLISLTLLVVLAS
jgi:hypothetical protein